jgi:molybdenum cofactor cytidylyltransferase
MRRIGAIVLAAGASARLGRPKQLVMMGDENLLERSIRVGREVPCSPIVVVLGACADLVVLRSNLDGVQIVMNSEWQEGMATSIRVGINALPDIDGVIVMVCDMPAVTPEHLRALSESGELTGTSYVGRRGVPAYVPKSMFSALLNLQGDFGARDLLRYAPSIELLSGDFDIDTEQDVKVAQRLFD